MEKFDVSQARPSAQDVVDIQQTLNLFSFAVDANRLDLIDSIFTPDAEVVVAGKPYSGSDQISKSLGQLLDKVQSCQHALSTLHVSIIGPGRARTVNMLRGIFFGKGPLAGEVYSSYGYYEDELVQEEKPDGAGRGGRWRIVKKTLHSLVYSALSSLFKDL